MACYRTNIIFLDHFSKASRNKLCGKIVLSVVEDELAWGKPPAGVDVSIPTHERRSFGTLAPLSARASPMLFSEASEVWLNH